MNVPAWRGRRSAAASALKNSPGSTGVPRSGPVDLTSERNVTAPGANPVPSVTVASQERQEEGCPTVDIAVEDRAQPAKRFRGFYISSGRITLRMRKVISWSTLPREAVHQYSGSPSPDRIAKWIGWTSSKIKAFVVVWDILARYHKYDGLDRIERMADYTSMLQGRLRDRRQGTGLSHRPGESNESEEMGEKRALVIGSHL